MKIKITLDMAGYNDWEREDLIQITISSHIGGAWSPDSQTTGAPIHHGPEWWKREYAFWEELRRYNRRF